VKADIAGIIQSGCKSAPAAAVPETQAPQAPSGNGGGTPSSSDNTGDAATPNDNADNLSFEQQVVKLVNEQRAANGLAPLTLNQELSNVARAKSQDMHDKNYFSHTSPTYGSPFDMLSKFGIMRILRHPAKVRI
jgi:uncharacterized protein YkwD